jgi:RimJ/RimL family protein N-acetyltransferase
MDVVITYQPVTSNHLDEEVISLFKDAADTPVTKCFKSYKMDTSRSKQIIKYLREGLSWCGIDDITKKVISITICVAVSLSNLSDHQFSFEQYSENKECSKELASILLLNQSVMDIKQVLLGYHETKMLLLSGIRVHPSYRNKGIATESVKKVLAYGEEHGYTFAGVVTNSFYAQIRYFEKLGFEKVNEVEYYDYIDPVTNTHLFRNIEHPHKSAIGYVKKM